MNSKDVFKNVYDDKQRASAYAQMEFPGTYYLAYRDLPSIISRYVYGDRALDFGCGAGRSTRFIKKNGFNTTGVDISEAMINQAKELDPNGDYRLIDDGGLGGVHEFFDLVISVFTFDNIPTYKKKVNIFREIKELLKNGGRMINLVSSPEIYTHEWASFSTKDFLENWKAKCGDIVKIIQTDIDDKRPVEDIFWPEADYRSVYMEAGLDVLAVYKPLAKTEESFAWVNETRLPPWVIYVLKNSFDK